MARSKLAAALLAVAVSAPALAADLAAARSRAAQCFVCHGADGLARTPDAPNLAGQNAGYMVKALKEYRSGKRENEVMTMMTKTLSDQDIALVASYFSAIAITVKVP